MVFQFLNTLITSFGYLGVFIVSLVSTSTIFLPLPLYTVEFALAGLGFNPLLTGLSAGLGSAFGEFTGYFLGAGSKHVLEKDYEEKNRKNKYLKKFYGLLEKNGWFSRFLEKYGVWAIIVASVMPFPFDFIGILAGATHFGVKKFFIATFIGKTIKNLIIAYAGFFVGTPFFDFVRLEIENRFL